MIAYRKGNKVWINVAKAFSEGWQKGVIRKMKG